jgi:predicted transcriptional regulator
LRKQRDAESRRRVTKALREKPRKWSELKAELEIPERKLSRILEYLEDCGLVKKHEDDGRFGRWFWYEYLKTYETKEDYEIALKHSEELFLGLDAILAEEVNLWLALPHPLSDVKEPNVVTKGNELKPFAEEHLKSGYPATYDKLIEFRKPMSELQKLNEKAGLDDTLLGMFGRYHPSWVDTPEPIKHLEKQRLESFRELADSFLGIKLKVKVGKEPLDGSCKLCPKVHISESKNAP